MVKLKNSESPTVTLDGILMSVFWLLTRLAMAWIWFFRTRFVEADVHYYFDQTAKSIASGQPGLIEYPPPIAWLMRLIYEGSFRNLAAFETIFVALILILDAAVTFFLWRRSSWQAAIYWTLFIFLVGPITWFRIDMLPAAAVVFALVLINSDSKIGQFFSGASIAIGAAVKLWPAMLISGLVGRSDKAKNRLAGFLSVGMFLGLASLLVAGWSGSTSALTWQSDRGVQIESLAATPAMVDRAFSDGSGYMVHLSKYNAWEIAWQGDELALKMSDLALGVTVLFAVFVAIQLLRKKAELAGSDEHSAAVTYAVLAIILAVIATNKTLSPQYIIWLAGPLAILCGKTDQTRGLATPVLAILGLTVAVGTQMVYPMNYAQLLADQPGKSATMILLARNTLLAVMTLVSIFLATKKLLSLENIKTRSH